MKITELIQKSLKHDKEVEELSSQLDNKASKDDVTNKLSDKRDKNIEIGLSDLSQEVKEAITGGSVAVVGENSVNSINVVNEAILNSKLSIDFNYNTILTSEDNLNIKRKSGLYLAYKDNLPSNSPFNEHALIVYDNINVDFSIQTFIMMNNPKIRCVRKINYQNSTDNTEWVSVTEIDDNSITRNKIIDSQISSAKLDIDYNWNKKLNNINDLNIKIKSGSYWIAKDDYPLNSAFNDRSYVLTQNNFMEGYSIQIAYDMSSPNISKIRKVDYGNSVGITSWVYNGLENTNSNKTLLTMGDSITAPNLYQEEIKRITGCNIINIGVSGCKYALIEGHDWNPNSFYQLSVDYDFSNIDYVWVAYGTNDFGNSVTLGNEDSTNPYEFYGAINEGIKNIFNKNPKIKIFIGTPLFRNTFNENQIIDIDSYTNTQGLKLIDYCNAIIKVCNKYRIPVFNAFYECGINKLNQHIWLHDGLHPSLERDGYKLVGERYGNFINNYI